MRTNANDRKVINDIVENMNDLREQFLDAYYDIDEIRIYLKREKNVEKNLANLESKTDKLGDSTNKFIETHEKLLKLVGLSEVLEEKQTSDLNDEVVEEVDFLAFLKRNNF